MARCEDYPCCGHTDGLPCDWAPSNVTDNPHVLCDHEAGDCQVEPYDADEQDGAYDYVADHDCPKDRFLDDPITQEYGVGGEMVALIRCHTCELRERTGNPDDECSCDQCTGSRS
jgi:ssDNA-binding Zn-finger/Zn-ribbon topoisomerase 1